MRPFVSEMWYHPYNLISQDLLSSDNWPANDWCQTPDHLLYVLLGIGVSLLLLLRAIIAESG